MYDTQYTLLKEIPLEEPEEESDDSSRFCLKLQQYTLLVLVVIAMAWILTFGIPLTYKISTPTPSPASFYLPQDFENSIFQLTKQLNRFGKFFFVDEEILKQISHGFTFENKSFISLGIIAPFDENLDTQLLSILNQSDFSCLNQQLNDVSSEQFVFNLLTHLVVSKNGQVFHIILFREVAEDALLVKQVDADTRKCLPNATSVHGDKGDEVYSKFSVTPFSGKDFYTPSDIPYFLKEKKSAHFIDCNRSTAKSFPVQSSLSAKKIQENVKHAVINIKNIMKRLDADVWLTSGTLLGWYRECKAIDYTTDADFATWSSNANPEFERKLIELTARSKLNPNPPSRLFNIFGRFDLGYEVNFLMPNGFKSDLFFLYPEADNKLSTSGHVVSQRLYYKYFYPSFTLCSSILLGFKVNVPCDPEAILTVEYGDWKTPVTDDKYDYKSSPTNRGPPIPYPKDFFPSVRYY